MGWGKCHLALRGPKTDLGRGVKKLYPVPRGAAPPGTLRGCTGYLESWNQVPRGAAADNRGMEPFELYRLALPLEVQDTILMTPHHFSSRGVLDPSGPNDLYPNTLESLVSKSIATNNSAAGLEDLD